MQKHHGEGTTADVAEAYVELDTILPFGGGCRMSWGHLINYVMACSFSFFRDPQICWDILPD